MNNIILLFLIVLFYSQVNSQNFRSVNWGSNRLVFDSMEIELQSFRSTETESDGLLRLEYFVKIGDEPCGLHYIFVHDTLVQAEYRFNVKSTESILLRQKHFE